MTRFGAALCGVLVLVVAMTGCSIRDKKHHMFPPQDVSGDGTTDIPGDPDAEPLDQLADAADTAPEVDVAAPDSDAAIEDETTVGDLTDIEADLGDVDPDQTEDLGEVQVAECVVKDDCDDGTTGICEAWACVKGRCVLGNLPAESLPDDDVPGDCQRPVCDGAGDYYLANAPLDFPPNSNACAKAFCDGVTPSLDFLPLETPCGEAEAGTFCDGLGNCVGCTVNSDCPSPANDCVLAACDNGLCATLNVADGTPIGGDIADDCVETVCDGNGNAKNVADDLEVPSDGNPCTDDTCYLGQPTHNPTMAGINCGLGKICDGNKNCVECLVAKDCPGTDDECQTRTCTDGVCGVSFTMAGWVVEDLTPGDCRSDQCDGMGNVAPNANDDTDVPIDGNECTDDVCTAGSPSNPPLPPGMACTQNGGTECNGSGVCVQCLTASNCGTNTPCTTYTCNSGICGVQFTSAGIVISNPVPGDCKVDACDGMGILLTNSVDNNDLPTDNNQCTNDVCTAGVPSNPPVANGTVCTQNGGDMCIAGVCKQCMINDDCAATETCIDNMCVM